MIETKEWPTKTLGELFVFKNGLNKGKEFFGEGSPIINYMDVYKHPAIRREHVEGKVTLTKEEINRYRVHKGDVFFTRTSETPEEVGISATLLDDISDCSFSGFVLRARPLTNLLLPEYCAYAFTETGVRRSIITNCSYTTRALTNGRILSSLSIPIPPVSEQNQIAEALSDVDELIAEMDELIEKKRDIMSGTMQDLLTARRRLPGFSQPWTTETIEEIGKLIRGVGFTPDQSSQNHISDSIPLLRANNIFNSTLTLTDLIFVNKECVKDFQILESEDILLCSANGSSRLVGKAAFIPPLPNYTFGAFMMVLRCYNKAIAKYYFYYMMTSYYRRMISDLLCGSAINNLNSKQLYTIEINHPSDIEEMKEIISILSDMDAEIVELEAKRDKYKAIRQGMMQQLLTGKIRLI